MAEVRRKISAASARAHTRKSHQSSSFKLSPVVKLWSFSVAQLYALNYLLSVTLTMQVTLTTNKSKYLRYKVIQPPPPKMCGSPNGPPVTAPRIRLKDGRHLAYKEHGVPRDVAKYKIIYVHGFRSGRHNVIVAATLSPEVIEELGVYIVSFDRPGYGESDPNPKQTVKSMAMDIEELADQLGPGSKFYVIGYSIGGQAVWSCLKYIPNRLATLLAPAVTYWWPNFPANVLNEAFNQKLRKDQWVIRVAHYAPWLVYWWNTQELFPASSVLANNSDVLSSQDKEIMSRIYSRKDSVSQPVTEQGEFESLHRDLIVTQGAWEFDPLDLGNPFANNKGFVHLWHGDEDKIVPITMNRYIAEQLPWIWYHEVSGGGHFFPLADGMSNAIIKALLVGEK
ncbi:hypothetical protein PVK06_011918 [Gossypium arboreum]|uniref:AB hydrolase-1 domain-containing protein n=2 Tax=Gossypium arboreum TaxID=29729 RepID=A0ABR0QAS1_GOSAR|nr:hypothetical protein PVK06_011918 [Gossypium arboreum]